jgi:hypothetical protein
LAQLFQRSRLKYEKVNERMPVSGELKNEEKRAITPKTLLL